MTRHTKAVFLFAMVHMSMALATTLGDHGYVPDHAVLFQYLPWWVRSVFWALFGGAAFLFAHIRHRRAAFTILTIMPLQRVVGYVASIIAYGTPGGLQGTAEAFPGVILWGSVIVLIVHIASWPDLEPVVLPVEDAESVE